MRRPSHVARIAAVAAASTLVLAACGSDSDTSDEPSASSSQAEGGQVSTNTQIYFVDGNTSDYSEDFDPGVLNGVKATFPGAELGDDFKKRLSEVDPKLKDYTYGPESYDATIVSALAAEAAKNDNSKAIAKEMQGVSADGTKCETFTDCKKLLDDGDDIDYEESAARSTSMARAARRPRPSASSSTTRTTITTTSATRPVRSPAVARAVPAKT
ncbi:MAG: hypothetical protein WKF83_03880 [Nocardioidaceae bacterium]